MNTTVVILFQTNSTTRPWVSSFLDMPRNRTSIAHQRPQQRRTIHFGPDAPIILQCWGGGFAGCHLDQCVGNAFVVLAVWNPFVGLAVVDLLEQASQMEYVATGEAEEVLGFLIMGLELAELGWRGMRCVKVIYALGVG